MNKGLVIAIVLLISALLGMAALYQFYVKAIIEDLQEKRTTREQIEKKLHELETTFHGTKPEVIIKTWRQETQPWADAITERTDFFKSGGELESIKVTEESIPKFYYANEFPKLEERLWDYVDEKRCEIPDGLTFGAPSPRSLTGNNPSAEEVETWMTDYEYGASIVRFVADSGASKIINLEIWPADILLAGSTGKIKRQRIGFTVSLTFEDLVSFLEKLRTSDRYFSIEALKLTNTALLDSDAELTAEMIVTQTHFTEKVITLAPDSIRPNNTGIRENSGAHARFEAMFALRELRQPVSQEMSWWTMFRRRWLPF